MEQELKQITVCSTLPAIEDDSTIILDLRAAVQNVNIPGVCFDAMSEQLPEIPGRDSILYGIKLAIHETCANIVNHAYKRHPGRIEIKMYLSQKAHKLIFDFHDTGLNTFKPILVPEPDLFAASGRGLYLIRSCMDDVLYCPKPGNNRWRLVKQLEGVPV